MTLKTDYLNGSSGLQSQLDAAFTAGQQFITTNYAAISAQLQSNAAAGNLEFQVVLPTSYQPAFLREEGLLCKAYFAGLQDGLAQQNIYDYECSLELNTSDNLTTSINFNFHFHFA